MPRIDTLLRDLRDGLRSLRRDAAVTAFIVVIAALGIGASSTVFSLARALVLRALPFENPSQLVWIANGTSDNLSDQSVQVNSLLALRETSTTFEDFAAFYPFYGSEDVRLGGQAEPRRVTVVPVTQTFFTLLGVQPLLGRSFSDSESRDDPSRTVVLGHEFWQRQFDADPGIIGRTIMLDGEPPTVIGVLPPSFDFASTFTPGRRADLFQSFPLNDRTNRRGNTLSLIGRLKPGVSLEAAQAEANVVRSRIDAARAAGINLNKSVPRVIMLQERISGSYTSILLALASAVSILMVLVCANISNLLLVRASVRRREMAVRAALGAARGTLVRQLLVESLLLGAAGAAVGVLLAVVATSAIAQLKETTIPLLNGVHVDPVVLGGTVLATILTGFAFGVLPALHATSLALPTALVGGARGSTDGRGGRLRHAIVMGQVAVVCVLLTGAGLLARSLERVLDVQPGFATENRITIRVDPQRGMRQAERNAYFDAVVREVSVVPGVQSVGLTDALPLGDNFGWRIWNARAAEQSPSDENKVPSLVRMIDQGYLDAMGIVLKAGRTFTVADDSNEEPVIIINERLASSLWPEQEAVGRLLVTSDEARRVVGVVGNVHYFGLDKGEDPEMYMPLKRGDYRVVDLVIRASMNPSALTAGIRAALRRADATLPVMEMRTMQDLLDRSTFPRRFVVLLIAGFAVFGVLLAGLGIYAVTSYAVTQRTREIGIRMALGATAQVVRTGILQQTAVLVAGGVAIGLPVSWMAARSIESLLFGVQVGDRLTFAAVLVIMAMVAGLAGYLPARRATNTDPATALRAR